MKNSETSKSERVGEKNKEKKHIVKHTTKKFKMSDFCFLFLSVERRHTREVKTLSYDSGEMWTWRFTFLFNFRGAQLSRCTFGAKFLAFLLPWSFFCRRAPSQGVAVWAVRRKKSHPRSPKRETFQNINYHSSSSAKYAKKMPNTKRLCELEIIWRENTIKQSVKASKRIVECLSAESNVTQHFLFLLLLMCDTKTAKRATRLFGCSTKCVFVVVWAVFDWDFLGELSWFECSERWLGRLFLFIWRNQTMWTFVFLRIVICRMT